MFTLVSGTMDGLFTFGVPVLILWGLYTLTPRARRRRLEKLNREFGRRDDGRV